jgi:predicted DCC family thiol-disulfide oxidoreductase YuxK
MPTREKSPSLPAAHALGPLLLFDGDCGLCQALVRFLLRRERANALRFAPLQGATGRAALRARGLDTENFDSLVFIPAPRAEASVEPAGTEFFLRTDAVVRVLEMLGGAWRGLARVLRFVPRPLRDAGYRVVARLRYRIFGVHRAQTPLEPRRAQRFLH